MARQRFSDMLSSRRRQLGLSLEQASRILRLREDVLVAFEEGDFERMPQSGYAQGMLSSYARYLGLDPRQITDLFQDELSAYVDERSGGGPRRGRAGAGDLSSRPKAYVEYHGLLPTSGGPAGDMGAFATTTPVRSRRPLPLAGSGPSAAEAYASQGYGPEAQGRQRRPYNTQRRRPEAEERPVNSRAERQRRRGSQQRMRGEAMGAGAQDYGYRGDARDGYYRRDDVSTRSIRPREYTDDMRYDEQASPYERASTISGRRSSRNIANMERPNVRRRSGSDYAPGPSRRGGQQRGASGRSRRQPSGAAGFFADQQRAIFAIILVLAVVLTAILVFSVSSCVNSKGASSDQGKAVTVNSVDQSSQGSSSGSASSSQSSSSQTTGQSTSAQGGSATSSTGDSASTSTYTPTVVKVSVASGAYTWLEITNDGVSAVAESVTGPWEQEFTVTDSLTVQAGDPSSVTVTNNGKSVAFTSKASGLGSLSVKGTKPPETTSSDSSGNASSASADTQSTESADQATGEE